MDLFCTTTEASAKIINVKSRQWQRHSLDFVLSDGINIMFKLTGLQNLLARRRNKALVSLLFATRRRSAQKAWKIWIKFVWQCRLVDIE